MKIRYAFAAAAAVGVASLSSAATFKLGNHPDGNAAPPLYGLRLDGLFGGSGDVTFSFDTAQGVFLTVAGGQITINGVVELVETSGSSPALGTLFDVNFTYQDNVAGVSNGWIVDPGDPNNNGTLVSQSDPSLAFTLFDSPLTGNSFDFRSDGQRISGDNSTWVGDGWLDVYDSSGTKVNGSPQDWLFTGTLIPLPSAAGLAFAGLAGLGASRRRRM